MKNENGETICIGCFHALKHSDAPICAKCGHHQRWWERWAVGALSPSNLIGILAVLVALWQAAEARDQAGAANKAQLRAEAAQANAETAHARAGLAEERAEAANLQAAETRQAVERQRREVIDLAADSLYFTECLVSATRNLPGLRTEFTEAWARERDALMERYPAIKQRIESKPRIK